MPEFISPNEFVNEIKKLKDEYLSNPEHPLKPSDFVGWNMAIKELVYKILSQFGYSEGIKEINELYKWYS